MSAYDHDTLRARFLNVIKLAGYGPEPAGRICEEYFEGYFAGDLNPFIKMLEDYERENGDPC